MLYSWPSKGKLIKKWYHVDADKITWTRPRLVEFLRLVMREFGADAVHIVAHSMGNRALAEALKDLGNEFAGNATKLRQIVFAAPHVTAQTFKDLAVGFYNKTERCTLYASSKDEALKYSKAIHKSTRAGDSGGFLLVMQGIDTIDVTAVDTSFIGHSFYGANTSVLSDLDLGIRLGFAPDDRPRLDVRGRCEALLGVPTGPYLTAGLCSRSQSGVTSAFAAWRSPSNRRP